MKDSACRFVLTCFVALALAGAGVMAGEGEDEAATAGKAPRSAIYFAAFHGDQALSADLAMLVDACQKGYLTHVIVGLFHCDWLDRAHSQGECVSLNGAYLNDPRLQPLWETLKLLQSKKIKIIASFGGGGVGDYGHLLDPGQPNWYPKWRDALRDYRFDGLDMDIEEGDTTIVTSENVKRILKMLRKDLGKDFIVTSAPVASALWGGSNISSGVNYQELIRQGWFTWYNLQFYNGFGDVVAGDYEKLVKANKGVSPKRFVAGVLTRVSEGDSGYRPLSQLTPKFQALTKKYEHFGGVYGWLFSESQLDGGLVDPVGWCQAVSESLRRKKATAAAGQEASAGRTSRPKEEAPARYTYRELSPSNGIATCINAYGDVAGGFLKVFDYDHKQWLAFLAPSGGDMEALGTLPGGGSSQAMSLNDSRQAAGWSEDAHQNLGAFLASAGQPMEYLGALGGTQSSASGMSNSGQVVGWAFKVNGRRDVTYATAFSKLPGEEMKNLREYLGRDNVLASSATAVGANGQIVGWAQDASGSWQAFHVVHAGDPLVPIPFDPPVLASQATALNGHHQIVGWALTANGFQGWVARTDSHVLYQPALLGVEPAAQAGFTSINNTQQAVGWYLGSDGRCRAFLKPYVFDAEMLDLDTLADGLPSGEHLWIATGINDSGWIVGQTLGGKPFLLTPKP